MNPVVIVGAPRSGTNMLRDVLTQINGIGTWPCDEINYIWRHGNVRFPSDELTPDHATPKVVSYIRKQFDKLSKKEKLQIIVEKTCANSLRVDFVDKVLPESKYIFIYRDGIDAVGSAQLRWTAKLDIPYIIKKVRYVPLWDLPFYLVRYFWSRFYRVFSREKRLAFWGPSLNDMQELLKNHTLNEVCAIQWQRCVQQSAQAFSDMPDGKVLHIKYERFVDEPLIELNRILEFLNFDCSEDNILKAVSGVKNSSVGKGRKALGEEEVRSLEKIAGDILRQYGYL